MFFFFILSAGDQKTEQLTHYPPKEIRSWIPVFCWAIQSIGLPRLGHKKQANYTKEIGNIEIIKKGSKVNLENCIINQLGVEGEVIELSDKNVSDMHTYKSNYMIMEIAYYINNNDAHSY